MIIDANNLILGRLGAYAAKKALLGEKIDIVNCEECVITGRRNEIFGKYDNKLKRGTPSKGPFTYRMPHRFVKRAIRGMLPYKKERGRTAFKKIRCYTGIPENFKDKKFETIKEANVEKIPNLEYITVKEVCKHIGAKLE
jgi:large subunit ribosomal protein L13